MIYQQDFRRDHSFMKALDNNCSAQLQYHPIHPFDMTSFHQIVIWCPLPGAEFYFDHGGDVDVVQTKYDKYDKCKHG